MCKIRASLHHVQKLCKNKVAPEAVQKLCKLGGGIHAGYRVRWRAWSRVSAVRISAGQTDDCHDADRQRDKVTFLPFGASSPLPRHFHPSNRHRRGKSG